MHSNSARSLLVEPSALLVAGFGNPTQADDVAGLLVAHRLCEGGVDGIDFWREGESERLPEAPFRNRIVIVDSVITGAPGGTIHLSRYPSPRLRPRSFGKSPSHLNAIGAIGAEAFLIGIEIETLRADALPSESVLQAVEWISGNFESILKIIDLIDDASVRLAPPTFFPRRYRFY